MHAIWNWFYLCVMRDDNAGAFEAGRRLVEAAPGDPLALWAFLHAVGGQRNAAGPAVFRLAAPATGRERRRRSDKAEVDRVISCYRELRARRPELAQAEIIQNVSNELSWAKRLDDEERFYRETVEGATQIGQIAGALMLAAQRGDADGLIRLPSDTTGSRPAGRRSGTRPARSLFHGPGAGDVPGDERLRRPEGLCRKSSSCVDFNLEAARRKSPAAVAAGGRPRSPRAVCLARDGLGLRTVLSHLGRVPYITARESTFPQVNEYFDETVIQVLAHGVRAFQARRSLERPGQPLPPPDRRGHEPRRSDLPAAGAQLDPVVERRKG